MPSMLVELLLHLPHTRRPIREQSDKHCDIRCLNGRLATARKVLGGRVG